MNITNLFIPFQNIGNNGVNLGLFNNNCNINIEENKTKDTTPKVSIIFKHISGHKKILTFKYGTTINDILKKYLKEMGKSEFINTDYVHFDFTEHFNEWKHLLKEKLSYKISDNPCP